MNATKDDIARAVAIRDGKASDEEVETFRQKRPAGASVTPIIQPTDGNRTCPMCRKTAHPSMTLSETMVMVQACPSCSYEYPPDEAVATAPATAMAQVVPIRFDAQQKPHTAPAAPIRSVPVDLLYAIRERLTDCELQIASLEGLKAEAKQLRRMLAAAERAPRKAI